MKKFSLWVSLSFFLLAQPFAQKKAIKKLPSIGFGLMLKDYVSPESFGKYNSLGKALSDNSLAKGSDLVPGIQLTYFQGILPNLDAMGFVGVGPSKYGLKSQSFKKEQFLVEARAQLNLKLLTDDYWFAPYLTSGVGATFFNGKNNLMGDVPVGGGLNVNFGKGTFLYLQSTYQFQMGKKGKENMNYNMGIALPLIEPKPPVAKAPPPPPLPVAVVEKDSDNDGIPDSKDKCPREAGLAKYDGCPVPDTDKDGIDDEADKCPTRPGTAKYNGCPVPDADNDGINDEEDACPKQMGMARYKGCPIPDTDKDGVNDELDKCPDMAGPASNNGCPEIQAKMNELAKSIFFKPNSAQIKPEANKPMQEVIAILKQYPAAKLNIEGHTDNSGNPARNKALSQKRADAIKQYFVKSGIEAKRLTAIGYGSEKPLADNKTPAGKAKNRRVELKSSY